MSCVLRFCLCFGVSGCLAMVVLMLVVMLWLFVSVCYLRCVW